MPMQFFSLAKQRVSLCIILTVIVLYSFTGEIVEYNDGAGWDGATYFSIIKDWDSLIWNHGIDSYHMTRILPFVLNHYILSFLDIEITLQSALICAKILNFLFLALLVFYFFKIADEQKWNRNTELIAFSFCFFNFPVLKLFGYYPLLCDCPALLLSYMGVFYYLKRNYYGMGGTILLSMLTWPFLSVILFVLAVFPRSKVLPGHGRSFFIRSLFVLYVPLIYFTPIISSKFGYFDLNVPISIFRFPFNKALLYFATISTVFFYAISTKVFAVNWNLIFKELINKVFVSKLFFWGAFFTIILYVITSMGGKAQHTFLLQIVGMPSYAVSDIFIFLETPFLYLGLFFLLIILQWGKIVKVVCENYGIGYLLVVMLGLVFLMDIETRKLTSFFPIMLIPLMHCLQSRHLKRSVACAIPLICLVSSFFWFPINTPDIGMAFNRPISTYLEFPAQRYYMFFGPWQSHFVYLVVAFVEVVVGLFIVFLSKKGLLEKEVGVERNE